MSRTTSKSTACKQICQRYKEKRKVKSNQSRYSLPNARRCSVCEIYIEWEGVHCPCCGFKLRTKPR